MHDKLMDLNELINDLHYVANLDSCEGCKFMHDKNCVNLFYDCYCRTLLLQACKQLDDEDHMKHIIKKCLINHDCCGDCELLKEYMPCIRSMATKVYERLNLCKIN